MGSDPRRPYGPDHRCKCGAITDGAMDTVRVIGCRFSDGRKGHKITICSMCPDRRTREPSR